MTTENYILVDGEPRPEPDPVRWATWSRSADRRVARTELADAVVLTTFVGVGTRSGGGPPLLYQTVVVREGLFHYLGSRETRAEAEARHAEVVAWAGRGGLARVVAWLERGPGRGPLADAMP
jgi:hypothetical protein